MVQRNQLQRGALFTSGCLIQVLILLGCGALLPTTSSWLLQSLQQPPQLRHSSSHHQPLVSHHQQQQQQKCRSSSIRVHVTTICHSYLALKLDLDENDDENNSYNNNNNDEDEEDDESTNHLVAAGHCFKGIDENVGHAMIKAGLAWTSDWSEVAEALEEASTAFWDVLSKKDISPTLQTICRSVAQELEDISTIEGCSSIGPATSIPNWIAIHRYLEEAAAAYKGLEDTEDEKGKAIHIVLTKTSFEIEQLIESF